MALDAKDLQKLLQLAALITQGVKEIENIIANKEAQKTRTEDENFAHAEERNRLAKELIEAL